MAWTAKLKSAPERRDGMNYVTVVFISDERGVDPIEHRHFGDNLDADGLKMFVAHKLRSLDAHDTAWATLKSMKSNDAIEAAEIVDAPLEPVK
jgi:hypothetical protein